MNVKRLIFPAFFLLFFSFWLILVLNVVLRLSTPQVILPSASPFEAFFGLLYWLVAILAAATSFSFGLEKLGILSDLRNRIQGKEKGWEPEVFMGMLDSQPPSSPTKASGEGDLLLEQTNVFKVITKVDEPEKQKEEHIEKDKMKSYYLFGGETEFEGCQHKFGFLAIDESKPIPDECFGCPKVIDCFNYFKKSN